MLRCEYCDWHGNEKDVLIERTDCGREYMCPKCGFWNTIIEVETEG